MFRGWLQVTLGQGTHITWARNSCNLCLSTKMTKLLYGHKHYKEPNSICNVLCSSNLLHLTGFKCVMFLKFATLDWFQMCYAPFAKLDWFQMCYAPQICYTWLVSNVLCSSNLLHLTGFKCVMLLLLNLTGFKCVMFLLLHLTGFNRVMFFFTFDWFQMCYVPFHTWLVSNLLCSISHFTGFKCVTQSELTFATHSC